VRLEGLCKLEKSNDFIENRNSDLQAFSLVHQPTTLWHVHLAALCGKAVNLCFGGARFES
jgi:hypothetical protein